MLMVRGKQRVNALLKGGKLEKLCGHCSQDKNQQAENEVLYNAKMQKLSY